MIQSAVILALTLNGMSGDSGFMESRFEVANDGTRLALRDLDGDGARDLIWITSTGLKLRLLKPNGAYASGFDAELPWPAKNTIWDFADLDGDGADELVVIVDSKSIKAWRYDRADGFDEGRVILAKTEGRLPRGNRHVSFARDIDGDERPDLVVPASDHYLIYVNTETDDWSKPLLVSFDPVIDVNVGNPDRLDGTFGASVDIPWFTLKDFDGDGLVDLVSETKELVSFHIAAPELPSRPTWTLDKAALSKDMAKPGSFDFADLFTVIGDVIDWRVTDIDGKGAKDLVVQQGSTFRIYLGGSRTGNQRQPDSLLKSGGRVLTFLLADLDGDDLDELLLVRAEKISLGRVVRWLVFPGGLDFDVFAYKNEGGVFSRKPVQRVSLQLKIPRLLSLIEELGEAEDDISESLKWPTTVAAMDADGLFNDIVDVVDGNVVVYRDRAPEDRGFDWRDAEGLDLAEMLKTFLSDKLSGLDDGESVVFDLEDLVTAEFSPSGKLRAAYDGVEPDIRHALSIEEDELVLKVLDLNGDGVSDLILFQSKVVENARPIQILISN
ncbi:MAG: hypothetical protein ACI8TQ_001266 [Planctomycetota bacterium]|jgi:hypothetical protein